MNAVKVAPGDVIAKDQALLEVQADKAALDVASPVAGRVAKILVKAGDQIKVGQPYVVIEETDGAAAPEVKEAEPEKEPAPKPHAATPVRAVATVNGDTEPTAAAGRSARRRPAAEAEARFPWPAPPRATWRASWASICGRCRAAAATAASPRRTSRRSSASWPPRRPRRRRLAATAAPKLPDFAKFGPVEPQPLTRVRKLTAEQMSLAWSLIPHVTQHDLADITDLEAFRKAQTTGPKLTVTAFALKAAAIALKEFPTFNASLDLASGQLILKRYYHIGVAVDTERGLLVPVIRDVDKKSVAELAQELTEVAELARKGKADMQGGTFTITNLGGIGGTGFTPIVNWPEVAILGMSRSRLEPVVRDGQVVPRLMLPLSLSYDHRVIDGAAAARFTRRLAEMLENPLVMLLHA